MIDPDLDAAVWIYHPTGAPGAIVTGGIDAYDYTALYGPEPYRFKAFAQNGSRLHLRMLNHDGTTRRTPEGHRVERRAYTKDVRRGVYWTKEGE